MLRHLSYFSNYTHLDYETVFNTNFPSSLTHLTCRFYTQPAPLPPSLLHLDVTLWAERTIGDNEQFIYNLPSSLTYLKVTREKISRNTDLVISSLPPQLIHLHILHPHILLRPFPLPLSLKHLTIQNWIDDPELYSSSTLTNLTFGKDFNSSVNHLPPSLKRLQFGSRFNLPINNLPGSLTHLFLDYAFNHPVNSLPSSLLHLEILGGVFDQPVNQLPLSLKYLNIRSRKFKHSITSLPSSLSSLILSSDEFNLPVEPLPPLSRLELLLFVGGPFPLLLSSFPPTITKLVLGNSFDHPLTILPPTLHSLTIGLQFNHPLNNLPFFMDELALANEDYSHPLSLPPFLSKLKIGSAFIELPPCNGNREYILIQRRHKRKWLIVVDENTTKDLGYSM